jgi:inner membrane protein
MRRQRSGCQRCLSLSWPTSWAALRRIPTSPRRRAFGKLLGGHRFLSHSILGFALFGFLLNLLLRFLHPIMPHVDNHFVWLSFMVGYASHLVMDSFTKEGVPWLLPIPFKFGFPPLKTFRITTGKAGETLLTLPLLVLVDVWLAMSHYGEFASLLRHIVR